MRFLPIILLASVLPCLPLFAGDENQNTNTLEQYSIIETTIPSDEIQKILTTIQKTHPFDSTFKFKQEALNNLICDGKWGTALCHLYQKDKYFAFQLDNLDEISVFPLELTKDEKETTIFKNLTFENESVYLKITAAPFEKECGLKLAQATNQQNWDDFATFQKVDENCPLKVTHQEVYKRKDIQKIEKMLKLKVITDKTFQFKQQALNYILCDTHHMDYPLCELHLKGVELGFALQNPKDFYVSIPEIVEDKPHKTILKYFDVEGNPSFMKIKIAENNPCFLTLICASGTDKSCVDEGAERQSVSHYESLAPFCNNYPLLK